MDKASVQRYDTAETITVSQNIGNEIPNDPAQFFLDFSTHVKWEHYAVKVSVTKQRLKSYPRTTKTSAEQNK